MFKQFGIMQDIVSAVKEAVENTTKKIIQLYPDGINGREEGITSQIQSEISLHLHEEIKRRLGNRSFNGITFKVYTYRKREENVIGADLAGVLIVNKGSQRIAKAYLAQAKVCSYKEYPGENPVIRGYDSRIQEQASKMLNITSDSFFFLYTDHGIFVVPALEVKMTNKNSIDSN